MKHFFLVLAIAVFIIGCNSGAPDEGESGDFEDVKAAAQKLVESALSSDSSIHQLLDALTAAQQVGLGKDVEGKILDRIKMKLEMQLADPGLCKKKLYNITAISQQLGFSDLASTAQERVKTALDSCGGEGVKSTVRYDYYYDSNEALYQEIGRTKVRITASVEGDLKESTVMGFSASGYDTFYFPNGNLTWSWDDTTINGCELIKRTGYGSEKLMSPGDGSFTLNSDGTYNGNIVNREVAIVVSRMPNKDLPLVECTHIKPEVYTETRAIEVYIDSKTDDMTHITGSNMQTEDGETGKSTVQAVWDLSLPK